MSNTLHTTVILIDKTKTLTPAQLKELFLSETNSKGDDLLVSLEIKGNKARGHFCPCVPFKTLNSSNNIIWQVLTTDSTWDMGFSLRVFDSRKGNKYIERPPISRGALKAITPPGLISDYEETLDFLEAVKDEQHIPYFPECYERLKEQERELRYDYIKYRNREYSTQYLDKYFSILF